MSYLPEPSFDHGSYRKTAILLINLGTPDAPTFGAVRRYLKEFLSDRRVVEIPRLLWWLILNGIILWVRPGASARKYAAVWTNEGSPLRVHSEKLASALRSKFAARGADAPLVEYAMRYGNPSIDAVLTRLKSAGADRFLLVPMYPQYAASTTGAAYDAVGDWLRQTRNVPEIRWIRHHHDHPAYIRSLHRLVSEHWEKHGRPARLLMSFHGLPRYTLDKGDPYHCECQVTGRLLATALKLTPDKYTIAFQSRFGRAEWLKPYTAEVLKQLGRDKTPRVDVVCPGFVADCLETLEEIALEGKTIFLTAGGAEYHCIPCLNERDDWIHALTDIVATNLAGWVGGEPSAAQLAQARERALALGAPD